MARKVDWEKIKTEYITGDISQDKLAKKYGVSRNILQTRAQKEKWTDERAKHRENVVKKAVQKAENRQASVYAKELTLLGKLEKHLDKALSDVDQFNRHIVSEGIGEGQSVTEERVYSKADMRALADAAKTLQLVEKMKKSMNNILSIEQQEQMAIARARLEIEQKKAEMAENHDAEIIVRFESEDDDWSG